MVFVMLNIIVPLQALIYLVSNAYRQISAIGNIFHGSGVDIPDCHVNVVAVLQNTYVIGHIHTYIIAQFSFSTGLGPSFSRHLCCLR